MLRFKGKAVEKQRRKAIGPYRSKAYGSQLQSYDLRCSFFVLLGRKAGKHESNTKANENEKICETDRYSGREDLYAQTYLLLYFYKGKQVNKFENFPL